MSQTSIRGSNSGPPNVTDPNQIKVTATQPPSGLHGQVAMGSPQDATFPTMPPTTEQQVRFKVVMLGAQLPDSQGIRQDYDRPMVIRDDSRLQLYSAGQNDPYTGEILDRDVTLPVPTGQLPSSVEDGIVVLPKQTRKDLEPHIMSDKPSNAYWTPRSDTLERTYVITFGTETTGYSCVDVTDQVPRPVAKDGQMVVVRRADDIDRLHQASTEQSDFIKVRRANPELENPGNEPRLYKTFDDFSKEARHLLVGRDASNKPMSKREELARGWGMFNQAREATLKGGQEQVIVFGRTQDVNHSAAGVLGYTSEYNKGSVLMPERWNYFMNTCWVMGGIKGDIDFVSGTKFEQVSRDDSKARMTEPVKSERKTNDILPNAMGNKEEDDLRSDVTEKIDGLENLLHYTTTVSVSEIACLKAAGYTPVPDDKYGVVLKPPQRQGQTPPSASLTLMEAQSEIHLARVGMAMENVTGDRRHAQHYLDAIGQGGRMEGQDKVKAFVESITDKKIGLDVDKPDNYLERKVVTKIADAIIRFKQASGEDAQIVREAALREIMSSSTLVANDIIKDINDAWIGLKEPILGPVQQDAIGLLMMSNLAQHARTSFAEFKATNLQDFRMLAREVCSDVMSWLGDGHRALTLTTNLAAIKTDCMNYVKTDGRDDASKDRLPHEKPFGKDEAESLFEEFRRSKAASVHPAFPRLALTAEDLVVELDEFKQFADTFNYNFGVRM